MRKRSGTSITECMLALAGFAGVLYLVWSVLVLGRRGEKIAWIDAAQHDLSLAEERIESDLESLVVPPDAQGIHLEEGRLSFFAFEPGSDGMLATVPVHYFCHNGGLWRLTGKSRERLGSSHAMEAKFLLEESPVGSLIIITLQVRVESRTVSSRFVHRIPVPADLTDSRLTSSYPFDGEVTELEAAVVPDEASS